MIALANELIRYCFQKPDAERLAHLYDELLQCAIIHFEHEEAILREFAYPKYEAHKEVHSILVSRFAELRHSLSCRELSSLDLAKYVIQEVVVGHIIKDDFEFFTLFDGMK
ncbi:Bacteriohemerythrin [bioreactor metagenome]|uniref:Bacteriohemerythrin n=1 Tax=bioreactor metagenome TaxID=1076179 RepID=A0A645FUD6_9ZZZZ